MKEGTFYARLYRRRFFFDSPDDDVMTCTVGQSEIKVFVVGNTIKVELFESDDSTDVAFFLGPNRHEFALDYIDGLAELYS